MDKEPKIERPKPIQTVLTQEALGEIWPNWRERMDKSAEDYDWFTARSHVVINTIDHIKQTLEYNELPIKLEEFHDYIKSYGGWKSVIIRHIEAWEKMYTEQTTGNDSELAKKSLKTFKDWYDSTKADLK